MLAYKHAYSTDGAWKVSPSVHVPIPLGGTVFEKHGALRGGRLPSQVPVHWQRGRRRNNEPGGILPSQGMTHPPAGQPKRPRGKAHLPHAPRGTRHTHTKEAGCPLRARRIAQHPAPLTRGGGGGPPRQTDFQQNPARAGRVPCPTPSLTPPSTAPRRPSVKPFDSHSPRRPARPGLSAPKPAPRAERAAGTAPEEPPR